MCMTSGTSTTSRPTVLLSMRLDPIRTVCRLAGFAGSLGVSALLLWSMSKVTPLSSLVTVTLVFSTVDVLTVMSARYIVALTLARRLGVRMVDDLTYWSDYMGYESDGRLRQWPMLLDDGATVRLVVCRLRYGRLLIMEVPRVCWRRVSMVDESKRVQYVKTPTEFQPWQCDDGKHHQDQQDDQGIRDFQKP